MRAEKIFGMVVLLCLLGAVPLLVQAQASSPPPAQPDQNAAPSSATPPPADKKCSTAADNPFPEDISRKAAQGSDDAAPAADKPPSSPGETPAGDTSSSRSKFEGLGDATGNDNESRISNGAGGYIENPKLAVEDVKVGGFYMDRHDFKGAYERYKEATLVDGGNGDAVFGLAEAARGLNHKDEAVQNYRIYLDAYPDGKKAKEARKALDAMGAPPAAEK